MSKSMHVARRASIKQILSPQSNLVDRYIPDYRELEMVVDDLKRMGYRIVLTQGVFDLIHEGHARYLEKALGHGDLLIVGVDTDEFTRVRKGPNRPVVPFEERLNMLAHLRHVSILTPRDVGQDIGELIRVVRPHVLIASESTKDFPEKDIVTYREYCEQVVVLPPQAVTSTTARIRYLTIDGADQLARELADRIPRVVQETLENLRGQ
jgi:D-beta-D-heptose 7-phosphate kinase/D-beta-D-heptose 1-phosphate adenosyltransferase